MRIAVLIKQVPAIEEMALGPDGRLIRSGTELEMSAYCRRAVSKAVELASQRLDCSVTVYTLGPPSAEEALREAVAWGLDRDVEIDAVLITDPAFAGSDTLATARAVAAALTQDGPFDLVLCGKNSVDADTGQVPPQIAELLDLPFATAVKELRLDGEHLSLGCELDDQWLDCEITLPAVLSCAERLCEPSKVPPPYRALVPAERIRFLDAETLGPGPWGQAGSPTWVGKTRSLAVDRERYVESDLALAEQVRRAVRVIAKKGGFENSKKPTEPKLVTSPGGPGGVVAVLAEPGRDKLLRELLGAAGLLAGEINGSTTVLLPGSMGSSSPGPAIDAEFLATYGADHIVHLAGAVIEEDVAAAMSVWAADSLPWAILLPGTSAGREIASRVAADLGAGLAGDAVEFDVEDGRLVAWKSAFGGQLIVAVHTSTVVQLATVRAGVLPTPEALEPGRRKIPTEEHIEVSPRGRVRVTARRRDDDIDILADASAVIAVGQGVDPTDYPKLDPLAELLDAELGCTRKVTDNGWMPHARQIGITGRSISPRLFVMIGASGKFNHTVGVRGALSVLAITNDPNAPAWEQADAGIVGDWQEALPLLLAEIARIVPDEQSP
ncbi:MAG: hypothetical protein F4003_03760 [Acidimicrobiaceae bacterium]|nr:hypothetical protein [Acidimicrobiaceae bacterium]MYC42507.1 hypothetical protein [Acidimicrobiaceae bacterium]MYH87679.1 hypothetical protein [Acidimicrobiaceae bacterium]